MPRTNDGLAGVTARDNRTAGQTLSVPDAVTEPELAVMVALPALCPVANPPLAIVATAVEDELHVTDPVRFCPLPSL